MNKYMTDSARTAANTLHTELIPMDVLMAVISAHIEVASDLDVIKKALFYGKVGPKYQALLQSYGYTAGELGVDPDADMYGNADVDFLHAILGKNTEAAELLELLQTQLNLGGGVNRAKVIDEAGDDLWYTALLFRNIGVTFEEVGETNIRKLLVRYPEKFTEHLAVHRDESAENAVVQ